MTANAFGIVRWTIAAFHTNPEADDDELIEILHAAGLPHAARAVLLVPLAYGRRILDGLVELPPTFVANDQEQPLAGDAIFAAADRIARSEATRADLDRIGLRSSEVHAVNSALHAGSKPEDLVLSPPTMTFTDREVDGAIDAQVVLDELLRAHDSSLALTARQFPGRIAKGRVQLQLDVVATVGERELIESFGGFGTTIQDALGDTFKKLTAGTLHVLMAVLDRHELGADQVTWEPWGDFDACLGAQLNLLSAGGPAHLGEYLDAIKTALLAAPVSADPHWVRTYIATNGAEIIGLDMLLDNHAWPPGVAIARGWPWPANDAYYARRHFFMLVPSRRETN